MPDTLITVYIILGAIGAMILILFRPPCVPLRKAVTTGLKMMIALIVILIYTWIVTSFTEFK